jgi:hypothetical protein
MTINIKTLLAKLRTLMTSISVIVLSGPFLTALLNVVVASVVRLSSWHHDIQYNNTRHNDIQRRNKKWDTQHNNTCPCPECPEIS